MLKQRCRDAKLWGVKKNGQQNLTSIYTERQNALGLHYWCHHMLLWSRSGYILSFCHVLKHYVTMQLSNSSHINLNIGPAIHNMSTLNSLESFLMSWLAGKLNVWIARLNLAALVETVWIICGHSRMCVFLPVDPWYRFPTYSKPKSSCGSAGWE